MPLTLVGQASTNSRANRPLPPGAVSGRTLWVNGAQEGVEFTLADGTKRRDILLTWIGGQAGLIFGGGPFPEKIDDAIHLNSYDVHGSYGHAAEHALADALGVALDGVFSSPDISCRFGLNGRDALDAAARVARAVTGRDWIATDGSYHGAGESFVHPPYPRGIPEEYQDLVFHFAWGDIQKMRHCAQHSAAIVVDAPALPDEQVGPFLNEIRKACTEFRAVMILDEVVSGFKFSLKGAAGYYGVKPDICTYGKAMCATGGVSAIVGRRDMVDYLDGRTFFSLTFGGEPSRCAVAAETVKWLTAHEKEVYGFTNDLMPKPNYYMGHLYKIGRALQDGLNAIFAETATPCVVKGQPERSVMIWDTNEHWLEFCSAMIGRGVVLHRPQFPNLAHTMDDVELTLAAARECLK